MHIGELARQAAVNIQTIRFYERQGLLPAPTRNEAGYRCYEKSDLERVTFISRRVGGEVHPSRLAESDFMKFVTQGATPRPVNSSGPHEQR
jgi:hypothetical protein